MARSEHTWCICLCFTISLLFSIFNAKWVPVGLCLTSFTRPNPPVPVSQHMPTISLGWVDPIHAQRHVR